MPLIRAARHGRTFLLCRPACGRVTHHILRGFVNTVCGAQYNPCKYLQLLKQLRHCSAINIGGQTPKEGGEWLFFTGEFINLVNRLNFPALAARGFLVLISTNCGVRVETASASVSISNPGGFLGQIPRYFDCRDGGRKVTDMRGGRYRCFYLLPAILLVGRTAVILTLSIAQLNGSGRRVKALRIRCLLSTLLAGFTSVLIMLALWNAIHYPLHGKNIDPVPGGQPCLRACYGGAGLSSSSCLVTM